MKRINDLEELLRYCWNLLYSGAVQNRHPYHTPVLATTDGQFPSARTVVLRTTLVEERTLFIYTDIRTQKVKDIQRYPFTSLVFWDKGESVQIRAKGKTSTHHQNEIAREKWENIPAKSRKGYATIHSPGTNKAKSENLLADYWMEDTLNIEKTEEHFSNFAVLQIEVIQLDFLHIDRSQHQRALFVWQGNNWDKSWLIP